LADQNIVTNITATANFSSLTAQLQAVTSQLLKLQATTIGLNKNLTSQVGVMNRQFDETMRSTGQFARHFVTLTSDVSKFGQNLDSGRMKLGQYFQTWQGHTRKTSSLVKELAKQQVMLENAVVQPLGKNAQGLMQYNVMVQSGLDVTKNKSALLRQELSIMNKVMNDGATGLINWGKNTQWAGRQLTVGLTVPLAAFGMAAAKAFRQADEELVRLTKVYGGLTATSSADLLQVRKDVIAVSRELASGLGANFKETIGIAADIAATGKQGAELIDSTRQTTRLAILGEVDRQDAMKATLAIQTAFGQNTMQLAESIDFLNAVENQTSTTLEDLVTAIPKAGPVVKALGGDVQDLALYLTAMREGGINASEGANALKSALASVINPTKVAKEMFMGLGIDLSGIVDKNAGNLTGTIMALKDSLDSLQPLQRARAIEQLFGKFQFARINALFENLGKEGSQTLQVLDLMKASTKDLASISERELKALTESASGKYRRALESVKADLAVVGEQFLKVGAFVLNAIDGIIKFIGNLPGPIKAVLGFIGGLTAIAGPIIMLTGVLGNFFGYIIKGVLALKNIGKGGTGFKLLTPELVAAASAAETVEQSFYSDTKAAATFSDAVLTLAASFEKLKQSAMSSTIATSNSMSTVAGNPVMGVGGRIVDKNNPLIGRPYSRDMSHLTPTGSLTPEQRARETIFSTVPGPKPVNQRISNSPQLYMDKDLPKIPGVTSVNGVSTGVVAAEAAKWHSMTAAIAMQSKAELAVLKTEIAATGTITASLADSYQALLPQMTKVTTLAAQETALIVQQLQAGKITVEAARAKIFALNAQVEAMIAQTATGVATAQARTLSLTTVPLTTQPVVNAAGRSNMKELFHKSETSKMVDVIARALGVRTSGAGYSMHTTKPRFNAGGQVESFGSGRTRVSGPSSISYDDRMGSVPLGGYVLNQNASMDPRNAALVSAAPSTYRNSGGNITALLTPKETVFGSGIQDNPELFAAVDSANNGIPLSSHMGGGNITLSRSNYGAINPVALAKILGQLFRRNPKLSREILKGRDLRLSGAEARAYQESAFGSALKSSSRALSREYYFVGNWGGRLRSSVNTALAHGAAKKADVVSDLMHSSSQAALPSLTRFLEVNKVSPDKIQFFTERARANIVSRLGGTGKIGEAEWSRVQHKEYLDIAKELKLKKQYFDSLNVPGQRRAHSTNPAARGIQAETPLNPYGTTDLAKLIAENDVNGTRYMGSYRNYGIEKINGEPTALAHMMPKFNRGGQVGGRIRTGQYNYGVMGNVLKGLAMRRIGATFGPTGAPKPSMYESAPWGVSSLSIKAAETLFANTGLRKHSQKLFYDKFAAALAKEKPYGYVKGPNGELKNALEPSSMDAVVRQAASDLMSDRRVFMQLSPIDRDIIRKKYLNFESKKDTPVTDALRKRIFGSDSPGFAAGGVVRRGKNSYGVKGNPAARAEQEAARRARAAAFTPAAGSAPVYQDGPLTGSRTTVIGNGGVRTNTYGVQGSLPYMPGLTIGHGALNKSQALLASAAKQIEMSLYALGTSIKKDAIMVGKTLRFSGDQIVIGARLMQGQIKTSIDTMATGFKTVGTVISNVVKQTASQIGAAAKMAATNLNALRASLFSPQVIAPRPPGALINPDRTFAQNSRQSFAANARYSTTAMLNPIQYTRSVLNKPKDPNKVPGQGMGGMAAGMGGMMVGQQIGQKVGGSTGGMIGSMGGYMAGMAAYSGAAKGFAALSASMGGAGFASTAVAAAGLVAPIAAVTAVVVAGVLAWKDYKKGQELNQATFGLTAEAAKKAGLRFTDFGKRVADVASDQRHLANTNKMIYESMKDGGTPFRISIEEYRALKKEVKETFAEQIAAIDRQPKEKVAGAVVRLKEQLIGAGMSAEEATKKIYTMLQLSNKKDQSISATIGNNKFSVITDSQSAAVSSVNSFGEATRNEGSVEKALSFNNALAATETGINDIIAKRERLVAKDLSGKTKSLSYSEAEKIMIDQLNASKEAGTIITEETVDELAKTNPNIKKVINGSDTIVSVWQKIRLQAQGFSGDLSKLSAEQVGVIANVFNAIAASVESTNRAGILKDQYANLDKLKGQISDYTKALKGQTVTEQISDRKRLSAINKQIEAINKLAEARKKALAAAQEDADLGRQIEKVRLEIQNAVSVGDTEKAQSLRIDLESLTSQQQTDAQMKAIDAAAEKATKPLKAAAEAISSNQQDLADSAALAGESLDKLQKKYDKQKTAIDLVNNAMTALYGNADAAGQSVEDYVKSNKTAAAGFVAAMEAATNAAMPKYKEVTTTEVTANGPVTTTTKVPISPEQNALALLLKAGTTGKVDMAIANSIKGGASLFDVVKAIKTYIPSKKDGNETFGNAVLTGTGKDAYAAYKNVLSQGQSQKLLTATGGMFEVFEWNKKSYVADATTGVIYPYDQVNKIIGKKAVSRHEGGPISGAGTATSDSIPAMLSNGEYVIRASAVKKYGVDHFDALNQQKYADGGPVKPGSRQQLPFFPWRPDLPNYWSNGKPTGNPYTGRWGELRYNPSKGKDIWGGTEPGSHFTGNIKDKSDYWHQMGEQPSKSRGPGMGIDKDPMRYAGSGASMGGIGSGVYGFGPLFFAEGGFFGGIKSYFNKFGKNKESVDKAPGTRKYTEGIIRGLYDNNPLTYGMNAMSGKFKLGSKWSNFAYSVVGKPIEEIIAGSGTKGDFANTAINLIPGAGLAKGPKMAKNIKDAKSWTHYAHQSPTELLPSIGRPTTAMHQYGPGTYGSPTGTFAGDTFGTGAHKLSNSPLAWMKTALGRGPVTEDLLASERVLFTKATGKTAYPYGISDEFATFLRSRGYSGYKTGDIVTNWNIGYPGFGLSNNLGKIPFGSRLPKIEAPIPNIVPDGLVLANGGLVNIPKFKNGINVVPQDMLAMIHKNESIIPATMNPFNPDAAASMPKYNFGRSSFSVNGGGESGASYTVNQNIYASEGMDVEALSNMIVRKAEVVIGQKAKVNVKMVGQGKNI